MGRIARGEQCSVGGCGNVAEHSVSYVEAKALELKNYKLKQIHGRVYLCKKHYKELKKLRKKEEQAKKWRFKA